METNSCVHRSNSKRADRIFGNILGVSALSKLMRATSPVSGSNGIRNLGTTGPSPLVVRRSIQLDAPYRQGHQRHVASRPTSGVVAMIVFCLMTGACTQSPPKKVGDSASQIATPPSSEVPETPPRSPASQNAVAFSTRYAHFEPAKWTHLPGWDEDDLGDAWKAFLRSCAALRTKSAWAVPCTRAVGLDSSNDAIRRFFEGEFTLYQIRNTDRSTAGVITGYYEPLLSGSRSYAAPYIYPVYGLPDDLLYLDMRKMPVKRRGDLVAARIDGRNIVPILDATPGSGGLLTLDIGNFQPDIRDKKLRVRRDGNRIVPYFTRAEIERRGLASARVLAWTDDPVSLYSMQIQGSGKIRLTDGKVLRVAYREQNGHPFTPTVAASSGKSKSVRTRGIGGEFVIDDDETNSPSAPILTPGFKLSSSPTVSPTTTTNAVSKQENSSPEVDAVVAALLQGSASHTASNVPKKVPAAKPSAPPLSASVPVTMRPSTGNATVPPTWPAAISSDPSYVFFQEIPDTPDGPIGALGVPLTAGRSVAVDPRTTPLGFPVFLAAPESRKNGGLNRLMFAQDTGGAIRGAVRADYFWGFGESARTRASRMKENGRMWLLLPKGQQIAAVESARKTRSIGGKAAPSQLECVVPDPDLCVEDQE